jgi:uncharacterized protein (TIGR02448 family)
MRKFYVMCGLLLLLAGGSEKSHAWISLKFETRHILTGVTFSPTLLPIVSSISTKEDWDAYRRRQLREDDALLYIASDGDQCGVHLESAIEELRATGNYDAYSDMELTHVILMRSASR